MVTGVLVSGGPQETMHPVTAIASAEESAGMLIQRGDRAELELTSMPAPPPGRVYQAWILRDDRPEADAVFTVDDQGRGSVMLGGDLEGAKAVLITVEPAGGSRTPTRPAAMSATPA